MRKLSRFLSRRYAAFLLFLIAGLLIESSVSFAFTPTQLQDAEQQNNKIQRQQQLQQQDDIQRSLNTGRPQTNLQVPPPPLQKGQGAGCRMIKRIMVINSTHMSQKEEAAITSPYAGKCLGVDQIEKLMSDLTAFYIKKGYVTTRVYLPAQDLSTGTLKIQVVPGKVSQIKTDVTKSQIGYLGGIFPGVEGHDLNLRDFEQGIDQINRLLSNNATIDIQPGANPGDSIVTINNTETKRWHLNPTVDNYGAATTGRDQIGLTASFDNLFGIEDFTSLSGHKTIPLNDNGHQASASSLLFAVPYGYTTLTFNVNMSNYDSTLHSGLSTLHLNGDEASYTGTIDHVVYRDQTSKGSVSMSLTNDITDTFIDNQLINVSSRTLTFATFGGNYSTRVYGGNATAGIGYTRGLRLFNALADQDGIPSSTPHAQFDKYTLTAGYVHPFTCAGENFSASTQFSGQYAPDALYGSQQFSIGGQYTVRGFLDEALANDNGYYLRNDVTWLKTLSIGGRTLSFRPLWALDVGSVGSVHPGTQHGTLVGTAIGVDLASGPLQLTGLMGYPLVKPDTVENPGLSFLARLSIMF